MTDPNIPDRDVSPPEPSPYDPYWEWYTEENDEPLEPTAGEGEV